MHETARPATQVARFTADERTAREVADRWSEILNPDDTAVAVFESGTNWTAEALFRQVPDEALVCAGVQAVAGAKAAGSITYERVTMRDWVAASLAGLSAVTAGRFVIHGAHDRSRVTPNQIGIEIEAALAFGTGHHGTTHGCLLAFSRFLKSAALKSAALRSRHRQILDVGTGTGVLAIAAARALHAPVLASDIDPVAVAVARDNAARNRAGARVSFFAGAGAAHARIGQARQYKLIFANILEGPLRRMSADLSRLLAPGGRIILSGLLPAHANAVIAAYRLQGLTLERRGVLDNWVTLTMRRERRLNAALLN